MSNFSLYLLEVKRGIDEKIDALVGSTNLGKSTVREEESVGGRINDYLKFIEKREEEKREKSKKKRRAKKDRQTKKKLLKREIKKALEEKKTKGEVDADISFSSSDDESDESDDDESDESFDGDESIEGERAGFLGFVDSLWQRMADREAPRAIYQYMKRSGLLELSDVLSMFEFVKKHGKDDDSSTSDVELLSETEFVVELLMHVRNTGIPGEDGQRPEKGTDGWLAKIFKVTEIDPQYASRVDKYTDELLKELSRDPFFAPPA